MLAFVFYTKAGTHLLTLDLEGMKAELALAGPLRDASSQMLAVQTVTPH